MAGHSIKDIGGLGAIVGHIKDLVLKIVDTISTRRERRLKNNALAIKNRASELANTCKFLEIAKRFKMTPEELMYHMALANGHSADGRNSLPSGAYQQPMLVDETGASETDRTARTMLRGMFEERSRSISRTEQQPQ